MTDFTLRVLEIIKAIPKGRVCTYGGVAALAGSPRGSRQVVRILHSMSRKEHLPWHRVINSKGYIAIREPHGFSRQRELLKKEGIDSDEKGRVDLEKFLWTGLKDGT